MNEQQIIALRMLLNSFFQDVDTQGQVKINLANAIVDVHLKKIKAFIEESNKITGETSDGYHTFNELYEYRLLYNAAFFNELMQQKLGDVHKSKRHSDGEECFGGGWFIVMATLPTGQISNHYELKDWDLFECTEREKADIWDGHTPQDVAKRIRVYLGAEKDSLIRDELRAENGGRK